MKKQQKPAEQEEKKISAVVFCDEFSPFEIILGRPKALIPFGPWTLLDLTLESISLSDFIAEIILLVSNDFEAIDEHVK